MSNMALCKKRRLKTYRTHLLSLFDYTGFRARTESVRGGPSRPQKMRFSGLTSLDLKKIGASTCLLKLHTVNVNDGPFRLPIYHVS